MAAQSTAWADETFLGACPSKHRVHPELELTTSPPEGRGVHGVLGGYVIWQEQEGCINVEREHPRGRLWFYKESGRLVRLHLACDVIPAKVAKKPHGRKIPGTQLFVGMKEKNKRSVPLSLCL